MRDQENVIASLIRRLKQSTANARHVGVTASVTASATVTPQVIRSAGIPSQEEVGNPRVELYPTVLLQAAVVRLGEKSEEGHLVEGVSVAWFEIIRELEKNPNFLFQINWRKLEEIIAGAYEREGWPQVVLTPRSGDKGRDVIATKPGIDSIRIIDQVKAYAPDHRVTADEVRVVLGVLTANRNVSKGIITTSARFAPGIGKDPELTAFMPHRLELKDGEILLQWLVGISLKKGGS